MRKFTPTEIDLCKKIAEKERREIKWGDCVVWKNKIWVVTNYFKSPKHPFIDLADDKMHTDVVYHPEILLPLWQEHDCLEWLKEREAGGYISLLLEKIPDGEMWRFYYHKVAAHGSTLLEALLHVVLAIMREK